MQFFWPPPSRRVTTWSQVMVQCSVTLKYEWHFMILAVLTTWAEVAKKPSWLRSHLNFYMRKKTTNRWVMPNLGCKLKPRAYTHTFLYLINLVSVTWACPVKKPLMSSLTHLQWQLTFLFSYLSLFGSAACSLMVARQLLLNTCIRH